MAEELRKLAANPPSDAKERRILLEAARSLYLALETPTDTLPRLYFSPMALPMAQVGVNMGLFKALASDPDRRWTTSDLAAVTNAEPALVYRVSRYLVGINLLHETGDGTYQATDVTNWLATPGGEGGVKHFHHTIAPAVQAMPDVLKEQGHRNPTDPSNTGFQRAHKVSVPAYSWTPEDPSILGAFHDFLKSQPPGSWQWIDNFPIESLRLSEGDLENNRVLFVDVGGGSGSQGIILRKKHNLPGKMILQDQDSVISKLDRTDLDAHNIEPMSHNFFQPQIIKVLKYQAVTLIVGAKTYYMRHIMHDWNDDRCVEILNNLREALASDSVILINDTVLPDVGAHWRQTQRDIHMMSALAALERSVSQWHTLLARASLRIRDIHCYNEEHANCVMVTVPT